MIPSVLFCGWDFSVYLLNSRINLIVRFLTNLYENLNISDIRIFFDNFLFSIIVFVICAPIFWDGFHWTVLQCAMCALTGAVAELIMEVLFSPIGYRITKNWEAESVGKEYLDFIEREKSFDHRNNAGHW